MTQFNPFSLQGKTLLVTGASSGIGRACAINCSKMGAKLVLSSRNEMELNNTLEMLAGSDNIIIQADLTSKSAIHSLVDTCPPLDGIIHCAGIVQPYPVKYLGSEELSEVMQVNLGAAVDIISRGFQRKKIKNGASLVFISSFSSQYPFKAGASYSASKAALETYSKTIAIEYANKEIRSNNIAPGMIKTAIFDATVASSSQAVIDKYENSYLLGFGEPDDVALMAVYLLSDAAKWVTGQTFYIDGGLMLGAFYRDTQAE